MRRILIVRLGAMGDIVHTLPAAASLKHSTPHSEVTWVVESKWQALLEGNPYVDRLLPLDRTTLGGIAAALRRLRREHFDAAVDFQGLLKSAAVAALSKPERIYGFDWHSAREAPAAWFYSARVRSTAAHRVDKYLDLAAGSGATNLLRVFPIPQGAPEGRLPEEDFVLASPLAGWASKQWPLENYAALARRLRLEFGMPLVVNAPRELRVEGAESHVSGLAGLIDATRRAAAVIGVDSGPLHIAAALRKPGVAIYGPTDPAQTGPYGGSIAVLRNPGAVTTYKRSDEPDASMLAVTPDQVFASLRTVLIAGGAGNLACPSEKPGSRRIR